MQAAWNGDATPARVGETLTGISGWLASDTEPVEDETRLLIVQMNRKPVLKNHPARHHSCKVLKIRRFRYGPVFAEQG